MAGYERKFGFVHGKIRAELSMEGISYQAIEKLRGLENWSIWKFAVKNLLRAAEGAYEVCIGDIVKPEVDSEATVEQLSIRQI